MMRKLFYVSTAAFWIAVAGFWIGNLLVPGTDTRATAAEREIGAAELAALHLLELVLPVAGEFGRGDLVDAEVSQGEEKPEGLPRRLEFPSEALNVFLADQTLDDGSAGRRCQQDHFLVHYQGFIRVPTTGTYTFYTINDDGFRLTIGTEVVINAWYDQGPDVFNAAGTISLIGNWRYKLDAWLYENMGGAEAHLYYALGESEAALVPSSWLSTP